MSCSLMIFMVFRVIWCFVMLFFVFWCFLFVLLFLTVVNDLLECAWIWDCTQPADGIGKTNIRKDLIMLSGDSGSKTKLVPRYFALSQLKLSRNLHNTDVAHWGHKLQTRPHGLQVCNLWTCLYRYIYIYICSYMFIHNIQVIISYKLAAPLTASLSFMNLSTCIYNDICQTIMLTSWNTNLQPHGLQVCNLWTCLYIYMHLHNI